MTKKSKINRNHVIWLMICGIFFISISCQKDDAIIEKPILQMDYTSPEIEGNTVSAYLGQLRTIEMTSQNVDYIRVVRVPKKWTVTAVIDRLRIKVDDTEADYDREGTIDLWLHNRTTNDSSFVSFSSSIDFTMLNYQIQLTGVGTATQTFQWGETKTYPYTSKYLNDINVVNNAPGWSVNLSANTLSVTAPPYSASVKVKPDIRLQGIKIGDQNVFETAFNASIEVYTVDISDIGNPKTFAVYNSSNTPIGLVCKETATGTFDDVITSFYHLYNNAYQSGYVFENGGTLGFNGGYTAGSSSPTKKLNISYDGKLISSSETGLPTTIRTYTVSDHEGNIYNVAKARNMFWMDSNLHVTTTPSGATITYSNPGGTGATPSTHGYLYTTAVATNNETTTPYVRGISPLGWHVPTVAELSILTSTPSILFNSLFTNYGGVVLPNSPTPNTAVGAVLNRVGGGISVLSQGTNKLIASNTYSTYPKNLRCVKDSAPFITQ